MFYFQVDKATICGCSEIGLELFEKYRNPIYSINFRVRQLKLKIAKVNLK